MGFTLAIPHLDGIYDHMISTQDRLEAGEGITDDAEQRMLRSWPRYGYWPQDGPPETFAHHPQDCPPDTFLDHMWDQVKGTQGKSGSPEDDISDLVSVANSSDSENESCTPKQVSIIFIKCLCMSNCVGI